jgi:hypothetical protein
MLFKLKTIFIFLASLCCHLNASSSGHQVSFDKKYPLEIYMESERDYIGQNKINYIKTEAAPFVLQRDYLLSIHVNSFDKNFEGWGLWWDFEFHGPYKTPIQQGVYTNAERYPFQKLEHPGISVSGDGRGCNTIAGEFIVIDIVYDESNRISSLALDFIQHCGFGDSYLAGFIRYNTEVPMPEMKNLKVEIFDSEGDTIEYKQHLNGLQSFSLQKKSDVICFAAGDYDFMFSAPQGNSFTVDKYKNADKFSPTENEIPGINICKKGNCELFNKGNFNVIDIEYDDGGTITSLALDFFQDGKKDKYIAGSIRYNSNIHLTSKYEILDKLRYKKQSEELLDELRDLDNKRQMIIHQLLLLGIDIED